MGLHISKPVRSIFYCNNLQNKHLIYSGEKWDRGGEKWDR